jgi:phosphonate transport system permease protein
LPRRLQRDGFSLGGLFSWAGEVWSARGWRATRATLWLSVAAIVLSGVFALVVAPLAARTLARAEPYLVGDAARGLGWRALSGAARFGCVCLRAIPEYVWAYLLVALLGTSAWPAVLALAVHNGGILGRLFGDTAENVDARSLRSLRMLGASRRGVYLFGVLPAALPRLLSYFFYRFESCVREATVMGFLGVVSLGYYIFKARARYDDAEMLLLVACGAVIVLSADLLSNLARRYVREAA